MFVEKKKNVGGEYQRLSFGRVTLEVLKLDIQVNRHKVNRLSMELDIGERISEERFRERCIGGIKNHKPVCDHHNPLGWLKRDLRMMSSGTPRFARLEKPGNEGGII